MCNNHREMANTPLKKMLQEPYLYKSEYWKTRMCLQKMNCAYEVTRQKQILSGSKNLIPDALSELLGKLLLKPKW